VTTLPTPFKAKDLSTAKRKSPSALGLERLLLLSMKLLSYSIPSPVLVETKNSLQLAKKEKETTS
tara:strand:- start:33 stop:227 length:195 start_codon:yes stop_codon:yes gene_type:complete